jgi:hypothetical protein
VKQIEDLAKDAFEAALAGDTERMQLELAEIVTGTPVTLDTAVQLWIDRLIITIGGSHTPATTELKLSVEMTPDDSSTGQAFPLSQMRSEIAWVGQMFIAHAQRDVQMWRQLWAEVPHYQVAAYTQRLLTTMAKSTAAYQEQWLTQPPAEVCCAIHAWLIDDPATTGARLAVAHRN